MCFDYEPCDWSRAEHRRARKPYRCDGCWGLIEARTLYEYRVGKYDGDVFVERACEACVYLRAMIFAKEIGDGCRPYESWCAIQEVRDHASDYGWWSPDISAHGRDEEVHTVVRYGDWRRPAESTSAQA